MLPGSFGNGNFNDFVISVECVIAKVRENSLHLHLEYVSVLWYHKRLKRNNFHLCFIYRPVARYSLPPRQVEFCRP